MDPKYLKTIRKILLIVCGVLLLAAAAVFIVRFTESKKDEKITEEKNQQDQFSYSSYKFNEAGKIDPESVNLEDYVPIQQFGKFYVFDNSAFLEQALEETYIMNIDNEYYINNKCYSCDFDEKEHYYFFGKDENSLMFCLKIGSRWDKTEWLVRKDFRVPRINLNRVSEIIAIGNLEAKSLLSKSLDNSDLYRINADSASKVTDRKIINQCAERYKDGEFVYDEEFDFIAEAKGNSLSGYVLAGFENSSLYQCIGVY